MINKYFIEAEKIVPSGKIIPILIIFFTVGILIILGAIIYNKWPNKDFYKTEINGNIKDIHYEKKNAYFLVDSSWYLIKANFIDHITQGDSIAKSMNTYTILIYDISDNLKWQGEVKQIEFWKVDRIKH